MSGSLNKIICIVKIRWSNYVIVLLCCGLIFSCSVRNNYKTLSFFFDGVPGSADLIVIQESSVNNDSTVSLNTINDTLTSAFSKRVYHDPYQFKGCDNCHNKNSVGRMISDQPGLCYQCHEDFSEKFLFLHGPAEGGFCTACHNPHSSKEKHLLNESLNNLCFYCHNAEELSETNMHSDRQDFLCTNCHNPHGGENSLMLTE